MVRELVLSALIGAANPPATYRDAVDKAAQATVVQTGMAVQVDQAESYARNRVEGGIRQTGLEPEIAVGAWAYQVQRERAVQLPRARFLLGDWSLTVGADHGTIGVKWSF